MHAYIHACMHACIHTYIHTYIHRTSCQGPMKRWSHLDHQKSTLWGGAVSCSMTFQGTKDCSFRQELDEGWYLVHGFHTYILYTYTHIFNILSSWLLQQLNLQGLGSNSKNYHVLSKILQRWLRQCMLNFLMLLFPILTFNHNSNIGKGCFSIRACN